MITDLPVTATRKRFLTLPIAQHDQIQVLNQQPPILWDKVLFKVKLFPSKPKMADWKSQKWSAVKAVLLKTRFIRESAECGVFLEFGGVDHDTPRIEIEITEIKGES